MKYTGYQIFVMIELARIAGVIENGIEYDTTWDLGDALCKEFQGSEFDDDKEPEYECMEKFLSSYNQKEFEAFLLTCEKVEKNETDEYVEEQLGKGIYNLKLNNVDYWIDGKLYTITDDGKLILNIGNGKTKILTTW